MQGAANFFETRYGAGHSSPAQGSAGGADVHAWLYLLSDMLVWSAFIVITLLMLLYAYRKGRVISNNRLFLIFFTFILVCGATFFIDALMYWKPMFHINTIVRFIAGIVSWVTVAYLVKNIPFLFAFRTGAEMQVEIQNRIDAENELKQKNDQLQEAEKLAKLGYIKWDVVNERVEYSDSVPELLEINVREKLNYQLILNIVHPDDIKNLEKIIDTIFIRKFFPNFYCRIITPYSGIKHLLVVGEIILSPAGAIIAVRGTIQDVTEQRLYIHKIQTQNQRLKDIAWIQSHKVRAPVASILGLVQLFNKEQPDDPMNLEVLAGVTEAAQTLDEVIKEINAKTESDKTGEPEHEE